MAMTLTQIETAEDFEGFRPEDFAVFAVPDFAGRMSALRARVKPRLAQVGAALTGRLSSVLAEPLYPHVAQHLRRTVNPPVATWVAFARSPRAYKPYVHLRVALNATHLRALVFVEDYADDKAMFARNLMRNAGELAAYLAHRPAIHAFDLTDEAGVTKAGSALDADTLRRFGERLLRVKGQHAVFGLLFADTHPVVGSGPELLDALEDAARTLLPLYDCGRAPDHEFLYVPEPIRGV